MTNGAELERVYNLLKASEDYEPERVETSKSIESRMYESVPIKCQHAIEIS
ncbi:hypothetical protein MHH93_14625 [Priestia sp. FSL H7-0729]